MVNCTDITDEVECRKHGVCACEWGNGKCLFSLSLSHDEVMVNAFSHCHYLMMS